MDFVKVQRGHRVRWLLVLPGWMSRVGLRIVRQLLTDVLLTGDAAVVFPVRVPVRTVLPGAAAAGNELQPESGSARDLLR